MTAGVSYLNRLRIVLVVGVVCLIGLIAVTGFDVPINDTVEYWSASRLVLEHENPYDPDLLFRIQSGVGATTRIDMWNPPWVLTLVLPLGILSYEAAWFLWLALGFGIVLACADWLWRFYGGNPQQRWVAWLLAATYVPAILALTIGQITPLLLLGLVLFLRFQASNLAGWAGASMLLIAVKPHTLYLVWVTAGLWAITERRWRFLAGTAGGLAAATAAALVLRPSVFGEYVGALARRPPDEWTTPTFGSAIRLLTDWGFFGLQFLPVLVGVAWMGVHWWRKRDHWNWKTELPLVVLVSVTTAAYGWSFDLIVLLIPMMQVAGWMAGNALSKRAKFVIGWYAALNLGLFIQEISGQDPFWTIWFAPALLILYLWARRQLMVPTMSVSPT